MKSFSSYITLALLLVVSLLSSCSAPENIAYFQDASELQGIYGQERQLLRLRPEDKINIIVNSSDPLLSSQFTLMASGRTTLGSSVNPETIAGNRSNSSSGQVIAYTVDEQGDITFPILGKISVIGKTRTEVADYISTRLRERELVSDAVVTVEYVNMGVNVLGEVSHPGHIDITKDHFTLLDALAAAGDLSINGDRERVQVLRTIDGEEFTYEVNLCSKADLVYSPAYYLQQNDVVYVVPNPKRQRESQTNGNTLLTPSFWMTAASFLITLITFITK